MQKWKMTLGTLAIGAFAVSPFVADVAFAGAETKTVKGDKPPEPTASEIETGQLLIRDRPVAKSSTGDQPPAPTASEFGVDGQIIDRGKGRPVAKSSTGGQPTDPTAAAWEDPNGGQHLDKGKGRPVAKSSTGGQPTEPTAAEVETGQLLIKDRPVAKSGTTPVDAAATENDLCGLPYTPPCRSDAASAKKAPNKAKTSFRGSGVITALLASAGAIGALAAFSGGNDGPTSP